jgi:Flp pilus assembly protein TadD
VIGGVSFVMLWGAYGFRYAQADAVPFMPPMEAQGLMRQKDAAGALALAQQAQALAPESAAITQTLAQMLDANGQIDEANQYYQKALALATSVQPEFQAARIAALQARIKRGTPDPPGAGRGR